MATCFEILKSIKKNRLHQKNQKVSFKIQNLKKQKHQIIEKNTLKKLMFLFFEFLFLNTTF